MTCAAAGEGRTTGRPCCSAEIEISPAGRHQPAAGCGTPGLAGGASGWRLGIAQATVGLWSGPPCPLAPAPGPASCRTTHLVLWRHHGVALLAHTGARARVCIQLHSPRRGVAGRCGCAGVALVWAVEAGVALIDGADAAVACAARLCELAAVGRVEHAEACSVGVEAAADAVRAVLQRCQVAGQTPSGVCAAKDADPGMAKAACVTARGWTVRAAIRGSSHFWTMLWLMCSQVAVPTSDAAAAQQNGAPTPGLPGRAAAAACR